MTEENQKKLYHNFIRISTEGATSKLRNDCKEAAAEILKSFPQFEAKEIEEVKTKPKKEK